MRFTWHTTAELLRSSIALTLLASSIAAPAQAQSPLLSDDVHRIVPSAGDDTGSAFGDLDGDGDLDLIAGSAVWLNDGTGVYRPSPCASPQEPTGRVAAVALADFDGDGDLDAYLAVASVYGEPQTDDLWINAGGGCFTSAASQIPPPTATGIDMTLTVAAGDVDGDTDIDIVVGNWSGDPDEYYTPGEVRLFKNNGNATFTDASAQLASAGVDEEVAAIALGDVDGDLDLDLVVINSDEYWQFAAPCRLLLNNGAGVFSNAATPLPAYTSSAKPSLAIVDVDGDARRDIVIGALRLWRNTTTGFVDVPSALPGSSADAAVGDVDGDLDLDLVLRDAVWLNDGAGAFSVAPGYFPPATGFARVALGDADGDSDLDALVMRYGSTDLYFNDGSGRFDVIALEPLLPWNTSPPQALALGDVDGDLDLDLLVAPAGLWLNQGNATYVDASQQVPAYTDYTAAVALADIDGDGDLDALFANQYGAERLALNDGHGHFTDAPSLWATPNDNTTGLALADVDLDGDVDVLALGQFDLDQLYFNDGTGHLAVVAGKWPSGAYASPNFTTGAAFGDLDGDGDPDAVLTVGGSTPGPVVLRNDGSGSFAVVPGVIPGNGSPVWSVALGDVDGDGDNDVLVGGYATYFPTFVPGVRLFRNDGAFAFTNVSSQLPAATQTGATDVALRDLDGDGDLDLLANGSLVLGLNDGAGTFADASSRVPTTLDTGALALGDIDGDGDLDAAVTLGSGSPRILINLTHQLSWRSIPQPGKPLNFDVWGEPFRPYTLLGSHAQALLPLGNVGVLKISRSQIFFHAGGTLDANGHALATWSVPNNPALVGTSRYWQVLLRNPRRLTNLEITTFVDL